MEEYKTLSGLFDDLWSAIKENSFQEKNPFLIWLFSSKNVEGVIYNSLKRPWDYQWSDREKISFLLSLDIEGIMNYFTFSPPEVEKIDIEYVSYLSDESQQICEIEVKITRNQAFLLQNLLEEVKLKSA